MRVEFFFNRFVSQIRSVRVYFVRRVFFAGFNLEYEKRIWVKNI